MIKVIADFQLPIADLFVAVDSRSLLRLMGSGSLQIGNRQLEIGNC